MRLGFLILCFIWILFLIYLGWTPNTYLEWFPLKNDIVLHFFGFLILTCLFYSTWELSSFRKNILFTFLCMSFTSIFSEILQDILPNNRTFDFKDVFYNLFGSFVGLGICVLIDLGLAK